jgi:hypothetical protein
MSKGCDYEISSNPTLTDYNKIDPSTGKNISTIFSQSYFFLNKSYVFNPKTSPNNLIVLIKDYIVSGFNPEIVSNYTPFIGEYPSNDKTSGTPKVIEFEEFPEAPEEERLENPVLDLLPYDVQDENLSPRISGKSPEL